MHKLAELHPQQPTGRMARDSSTASVPARLEELLLKVMPLLAPPGRTLSLAASDKKRLKGTTHVVIKPKPKMYSRVCQESLQKCNPHNILLKTKKPTVHWSAYGPLHIASRAML